MIYYTCDICDTPNIVDVNSVVVSIKVNGTWFGSKKIRHVCRGCIEVGGYNGPSEVYMFSSAFKKLWEKLWQKNQK